LQNLKNSHKKEKRKYPLIVVLLITFVLLSLTAAFSVRFIAYFTSKQSINIAVSDLRREINTSIKNRLTAFFSYPLIINHTNDQLIAGNFLSVEDQNTLSSHFLKQLDIFPSVTSIYFGSNKGGIANAGREMVDQEEHYRYIIETENFEEGLFVKYRTDSSGSRLNTVGAVPDFDARTRSWYTRAAAAGTDVWSGVYVLFTGQDLAISASKPVYNTSSELLGVLSVDIFLSQLSSFLSELTIGETGQSFIMERSGNLIAASTNEQLFRRGSSEEQYVRIMAAESSNLIISQAAQQIFSLFADFGISNSPNEPLQFEFLADKNRYFGQALPLNSSDNLDWLIVTVIPESDFMRGITHKIFLMDLLITVILIFIVVIGIMIASSITRPIFALEQFFKMLADGNWNGKLSIKSRIREIHILAASGRHMAEQLKGTMSGLEREVSVRRQAEEILAERNSTLEKTLKELETVQKQVIQQERLASIGHLTSGIAHDFNNMLAIISGYTEILLDTADGEGEIASYLLQIDNAARRSADLVSQLLTFARRQPINPKIVDLNDEIDKAMAMLQRLISENIELVWQPGSGIDPIEIDPAQITQILTNLIVNSRDAIEHAGIIRIETRSIVSDKSLEKVPNADAASFIRKADHKEVERYVALTIADNGSGMDETTLLHAFEPFFSSKRKEKGSGLGLSTVYGIVKQNHGEITLESREGEGTTISILFPAAEKLLTEIPSPKTISPRGRETILLVEDEDGVRNLIDQMLQHAGYTVIACANPAEALESAAAHLEKIDLLVSDVVMPQMNGFELYEHILEYIPDMRVLFISGYPDEMLDEPSIDQRKNLLLPKPFTYEQLSIFVRQSLEKAVR
jgi:signal transduction histidine kinase